MAMGTLLASSAAAQVVEGYIQLPDSLGVFRAPYEVAWDYTPGEERLFVAGESSEVLVIDAVDFRKLARIPVQARSLCFNPAHNELYIAERTSTSLAVVDGSSYQVIKRLQLGDIANWLFYNPIVDRVYCGTYHWRVIDCASDSIVDTLHMDGWGAIRAFDSTHNKLYVSTASALKAVDCYSDSVVAAVQRVRGATAICYNSTSDRVYATTNTAWDETLYVVDTKADSVVSLMPMPNPAYPDFYPTLAMCCDPVRSRVFTACSVFVTGIDCATNAWMWWRGLTGSTGVTCAPDLDKVYVAAVLTMSSLWEATGECVGSLRVDGRGAPPVYLSRMNRAYWTANWGQLVAIDCDMDTILGQVPMSSFMNEYPERVCVDTVDNKLYFAFAECSGYLGVVDCSARLVRSHQMCKYPEDMVHDALDDKLYVSTRSEGLSVFDCKSDSLTKFIRTGYVRSMHWHPELNKVYAGTIDSLWLDCYVTVVDCATDSVIRQLQRSNQSDPFCYSLLSTESDQFWGFSGDGYTVVDCLRDSVVMDTFMDNLDPKGVCYSDAQGRVYVAHNSEELVVLSMTSLRPVRCVQLTGAGHAVDAMIHLDAAGKIYVAVMNGPDWTDSVYVVDTGTDSVVARFDAGHIIRAMCEDATGRYVYCIALCATLPGPMSFLVIDTQSDSIVSEVSLSELPDMYESAGKWLLPNRRTGRIYVGQGSRSGRLLVVRDSVVIGLQESGHTASGSAIQQTVVSRRMSLRSATPADLYDASGRRAAVLRPGANDISHLAPGVYFVREEPQATSHKPRAVLKIVVAR